jgi:drug/metabolite transporter (DMT)-like permease
MAAVLVGATALGFSAIFVKWAEAGGATTMTVGFYRMLFALPGALLLAWRSGGWGEPVGRRWGLLAGVAFFFDLGSWHVAMNYTTVANATFILCGLSPIWVALFSVLALRRRYRGWVGSGRRWASQARWSWRWRAARAAARAPARSSRSQVVFATRRSRSRSRAAGGR